MRLTGKKPIRVTSTASKALRALSASSPELSVGPKEGGDFDKSPKPADAAKPDPNIGPDVPDPVVGVAGIFFVVSDAAADVARVEEPSFPGEPLPPNGEVTPNVGTVLPAPKTGEPNEDGFPKTEDAPPEPKTGFAPPNDEDCPKSGVALPLPNENGVEGAGAPKEGVPPKEGLLNAKP